MNSLVRSQDIVSGSDDLEHLYTFKQFPVFMGSVTQPVDQDLTANMDWYISPASGMIQLKHVLPLEVVYQTEHNPGTTGQGWLDHHRALSDFINQHNPKRVFEIGGAHGILSEYCAEHNPSIDWTILEPNPIPVQGLKAKMQKGFFTDDTPIPANIDMIVHSHVLEHVYNPENFFKALGKLPNGTKLCFSIPSLKSHMQQCFTNTLNFEHTYFCIEEYVMWWLQSHGYDILEVKYYNVDHSIFYSAIKRGSAVDIPCPELYEENKKLFNAYIDYHIELVKDINDKIKQGSAYLFGAHVFSQYLLAFGLDRSSITAILDNSKAKQGKRLYGTDLMVNSPSILKGIDCPIVILRSGVFNKEIKEDILTNINPTCIFLE